MLPIGDTLLTLPTVKSIKRKYPNSKITALANSSSKIILQNTKGIDDIIVLPLGGDWKGVKALFNTLKIVNEKHFKIAVNFTSPAYKWISLICRIPIRTYMKFDKAWWFIPSKHEKWRKTHSVIHYYNCARELNLPNFNTLKDPFGFKIPDKNIKEAEEFLRKNECPNLVIGIHAGGSYLNGLKRWSYKDYAELADFLIEKYAARIILLGGEDEKELSLKIKNRMKNKPVISTGKVPLLTSFAIVSKCSLFIGNDSSLLHTAGILGTLYIGIFGPTSPDNFAPIEKYKKQGCIITPPISCRTPQYFIGGNPIWYRPDCNKECKALQSIKLQSVISIAEKLIEKHLSSKH